MRRAFLAVFTAAILAVSTEFTRATVVTNVNIGDFFFSPTAVTVNVNDSVMWTWVGTISHSTTDNTVAPLWDSGLRGNGAHYTNTFTAAGTFPYFCSLHTFMTASVTVQSANIAPSIALTWPTNGAILAAPWTGTLRASTSDPDDTVSKVDFYNSGTLLGTVSNPPASLSLSVTNLAAGTYNLKTVATDSRGAITTSATNVVHVVSPGPIQISSAHRVSAGTFEFLYSATPGLSYIVQRSADLSNFVPLSTNTANTNLMTATDTQATDHFNFYSVKLQPNP